MTIAGDYIGRVRLGVTIGVAGSQSFVWPDGIPAGTYTADAGADGAITLTATVDGDTLTVAWGATDSRRMIGHPWRVLRDGTWLFGDLYVVEAEPSDDDPTEYTVLDGTVEVRVAMVAPAGGIDLPVSSDDVDVPEQGDLTTVLTGLGGADYVVAVFADDFAADGTFTEVPLHNGATIPRAYLAGATILVVDGDQLGLWTVPASGPCTAGPALVAGDVVAGGNGLLGVASATDGVTVDAVQVQASESYVGDVRTELLGDLDTLDNRVTVTEDDITDLGTGALAGSAAAADHTRSETLARRQTDPLLAVCNPWGGSHDDGAYTTDAPDTFTDGMWVRFTVTPLPVEGYTDPADGASVFSEVFTQTAEGIGVWDILEAAVERRYDAAAGVWRSFLFFEATVVGGTVETISRTTYNSTTVGGVTYPAWEMPEGVPTECAVWLDFVNGDGVWDLKLLRRTHYGTAEVTADGAEWDVVSRAVGGAAGSIASSIYPWAIGMGNGAVLLNEVQIRNGGPAGTLLARPTAALAAAAGEGVAFTDGQGNEWTPGIDAGIFDPTATGGGVSLGETSTTAYRGDRGATAYTHSQVVTGNPHGTTASDVGAVATTRTLTAGTGLTGGGSLAADRTLAVDSATLARIGTTVDTTSDTAARTSTTAAADGVLEFPVAANTTYRVDLYAIFQGDATADLKVGFTMPTGTIHATVEGALTTVASGSDYDRFLTLTASAATAVVGIAGASTPISVRITGVIHPTAAGTVAFIWAPNGAGAGTGVTRLARSQLYYRAA